MIDLHYTRHSGGTTYAEPAYRWRDSAHCPSPSEHAETCRDCPECPEPDGASIRPPEVSEDLAAFVDAYADAAGWTPREAARNLVEYLS